MDGVKLRKNLKATVVVVLLSVFVGCTSTQTSDEDLAPPNDLDAAAADGSSDAGGDSLESEFSQTDSSENAQTQEQVANNFENADGAQPSANGDRPLESSPVVEQAPPPVAEPQQFSEAPPPAPVQDFTPVPAQEFNPTPVANSGRTVNITNFKYRANDNGGTFVVEADGPIDFQTRINVDNNQFIVEIPQSILPERLKRPFNTKEMPGSIGSIDAYQSPGSRTSRIVVQLRPGAAEPAVQSEGNSLLIVAAGRTNGKIVSDAGGSSGVSAAGSGVEMSRASESASQEILVEAEPQYEELPNQILSSQSLEEYLRGNTKFFGKKISIETTDMDIRDVFRLISEETGANIVLSDDVRGSISIRLRQIPWDQALVVIMRAKKLGYTRTGNVLRIATLKDIRDEEDEALNLAEKRKRNSANIRVKLIPVSYAKVEDLAKQVAEFTSKEITFKDGNVQEKPIGKIVADARISALVVSDTVEAIARIEKVVKSLDVAPQQVLIEGKIVEATEQFSRSMGINWNFNGAQARSASNSNGTPISSAHNVSVINSVSAASSMTLSYALGNIEGIGNLSAVVALYEKNDEVKVLSSPRVLTLHNETATIEQSTQIPYKSLTTSATGISTVTVEFKPVVLKLNVTPQISNDGAIIMKTEVKREFPGAQDTDVGAAPINSRSASTKILVMNGQTGVIGGIYESDATTSTQGTPWLQDIPILGWLFKARSTNRGKKELLIFLTPRMVNNSLADNGGRM